MPKRTREYRETFLADLQDPMEASEYLNAALEDSDEMFLVALRDVAEARQLARVAAEAGVARETIYRMLSKSGNPTYANLLGVLKAIGVRMCFAPIGAPLDTATEHKSATSRNAIGKLERVGAQRRGKRKGRSIQTLKLPKI